MELNDLPTVDVDRLAERRREERRAVEEAGGGESEGFEASEEALIENATHGDGRADPISDAFTAEVEADEVTGRPGEADEERVSDSADDEDRPER